MLYLNFSPDYLERLWKRVKEDFPALPGIDYSSSYQKVEEVEEINFNDQRLVVFRGIVTSVTVEGKYLKFHTKYGHTMMFDVNYLQNGVINYGESIICEIIYIGGILRVNNLKKET